MFRIRPQQGQYGVIFAGWLESSSGPVKGFFFNMGTARVVIPILTPRPIPPAPQGLFDVCCAGSHFLYNPNYFIKMFLCTRQIGFLTSDTFSFHSGNKKSRTIICNFMLATAVDRNTSTQSKFIISFLFKYSAIMSTKHVQLSGGCNSNDKRFISCF